MILSFASHAQQPEFRRVRGYKTGAYDVLFNPYPIPITKDVNIRVFTPFSPISVIFVFDKKTQYSLKKEGDYWRGAIKSPADYKEGWNLSFVYIKYKRGDLDKAALQKAMAFFKKMFAAVKLTSYQDHVVIEGKIWIRAYKVLQPVKLIRIAPTVTAVVATPEVVRVVPPVPAVSASPETAGIVQPKTAGSAMPESAGIVPPMIAGPVTFEARPTSEAAPSTFEAAASPEVYCLTAKGSKTINFVSRSIEGTKEGFVPGLTREESLRISVLGKIDKETDVDANFISTSTSGTTANTQNEEKVSILVRRASTEAYFGDFMAAFNDTEFGRLNKSLSGVKLSGNYSNWGFLAFYSTPRGQEKYFRSYGDGTQGPYNVGASPVVVDSDRVYLDGVEQKRGDDYTIDYQAGTITFRKMIILTTSIIEAYYDWSETLYQHTTVGLRYRQNINDDLKVGATYIDDSDSLYKASEIRDSLSATVEPTSHYLVGFDGSVKLGNTRINSEVAYSNRNLNILEPAGNLVTGKAFKMDTSTEQGPFSLLTNYKRIGPSFMSIADASPKQDENQYGGDLVYRPSSAYLAEVNSNHDDYKLFGTKYLYVDNNFKSKFTPADMPSFNYYYRQTEDSNDPVTGTKISRITTDHNADSSYKYGFLMSTIGGGVEERVNSYPSREVTTYKTVNFGTATYGLERVSVSGNVELKETDLPDKTSPFTKTYNANASVTPDRNYFGSLSLQVIDDSVTGITNVTDLNYRASPTENFSTDGKYTISSVKEDFNGTSEAVTRQSGSFKLDFRPSDIMRYRYYYKPSFTRVEKANTFSFTDFVNQGEILYSPIKEFSGSLIYNTEGTMNIDRTDPVFKREANDKNTYDTTVLLKSAPLRYLSLEFTYLNSDLFLTQQTTPGATAYYKTTGNTKQYDFDAKTSLSERFSIDSRYSRQNQYQSSGLSSSDIDSTTQTAYFKGLWNYNENWVFFASISCSETINRLLTDDDTTYTVMPGCGISYIYREILRIDGEYDRSRSYAATSTEIDTYSLKVKYDPNEYVHINLRGTREISLSPDYKTTEILGGLEFVM